jgi:beta-lactamase regulating signal transducer with metallopeptidase domain
MTLWIAWSVLISALLAVAGAAVEQAAANLGAPRRFIWLTAMAGSALIPLVLSVRPVPAVVRSVVTPGIAPLTTPIGASDLSRRVALRGSVAPGSPGASTRWIVPISRVRTRTLLRAADPWIVRAWLLTSLALLVAFSRSIIALRREWAQWGEADTEVGRVLVSRTAGPAVVGFAHPRIVIPTWALSVEPPTRTFVLRHEVEHIRAGDSRALLIAELLCIALPWNAALWWMMRQLRLAIEMDCDVRVLRGGGGAREYGLVLLAVGERYATTLPLSASLSEPRLNLEARINAMTASRPRRPVVASLPFAAFAVLALTAATRTPRPSPLVTAPAGGTARTVPSPVAKVGLPQTPIVVTTTAAPSFASVAVAAPPIKPRARQPRSDQTPAAGAKRDTLDSLARITVDFQNADIREVIRVFSNFSGRTMVVGKSVTGLVTTSIKDQPWLGALRSILQSQGLAAVDDSTGVIIVVAKPDLPARVRVPAPFTGRGFLSTPPGPLYLTITAPNEGAFRLVRWPHYVGGPVMVGGGHAEIRMDSTVDSMAVIAVDSSERVHVEALENNHVVTSGDGAFVMIRRDTDFVSVETRNRAPSYLRVKHDPPTCDASGPVFVIDGVPQSAPCGKPPSRFFAWFIEYHRPPS